MINKSATNFQKNGWNRNKFNNNANDFKNNSANYKTGQNNSKKTSNFRLEGKADVQEESDDSLSATGYENTAVHGTLLIKEAQAINMNKSL